MAKYKYKIGDFVLVSNTVEFIYESLGSFFRRRVELKVPKESFIAQITGATYRQLGKLIISWSYEESSYFKCESTILVWKVKRGITNKEIDVLDDGIKLLRQTDPHGYPKLPWRYRSSNG